MGFEPFAYKGPETGNKNSVSYVLKKNKIFIILTTPLNSSHVASKWLLKHGDGIVDVAINVDDAKELKG